LRRTHSRGLVNDVLRDLSSPALARAIEENAEEFLVALGRAAGAKERDDPRVRWVIGDIPIDYHNCVVRAELLPEDADGVILESLERFRAQGAPGSWHVGPSMRPADLGERLLKHGFSYGGSDIGMAADLRALPERVPVPEDLAIERVRDEEGLAAWRETLARGFGEGPLEAEWVSEMYRRLGLGDHWPWRHYLGRLGGEPVATSTLFMDASAAGVYFVFTVEEARRRGIGAAMTLTPLLEARETGYRVGVLGSSNMGYPVYRRLGFREYCEIRIYEWHPPGP
jgi:GNAT superfamily N-acetyltransferase